MKKIISLVLVMLFSGSVFASAPAISVDNTQASNAIEYNYSNIDGVSLYTNSELSEVEGDGWFRVVFTIVRVLYALTKGATVVDAPEKE